MIIKIYISCPLQKGYVFRSFKSSKHKHGYSWKTHYMNCDLYWDLICLFNPNTCSAGMLKCWLLQTQINSNRWIRYQALLLLGARIIISTISQKHVRIIHFALSKKFGVIELSLSVFKISGNSLFSFKGSETRKG